LLSFGTEILSSNLLPKIIKIKIYRNIIFLVVFYVCETMSFTIRKERRLRAFENIVLRRIFVPNGDEVTGERRIPQNEKPKQISFE